MYKYIYIYTTIYMYSIPYTYPIVFHNIFHDVFHISIFLKPMFHHSTKAPGPRHVPGHRLWPTCAVPCWWRSVPRCPMPRTKKCGERQLEHDSYTSYVIYIYDIIWYMYMIYVYVIYVYVIYVYVICICDICICDICICDIWYVIYDMWYIMIYYNMMICVYECKGM